MPKKKILIREFAVSVYADGEVSMDGFDKFLLWKLNQEPKEGFLPHAYKIQRFRMCVKNR